MAKKKKATKEQTIADLAAIKAAGEQSITKTAKATNLTWSRVRYLLTRYPSLDYEKPAQVHKTRSARKRAVLLADINSRKYQPVIPAADRPKPDHEKRERGVAYWGDTAKDTFF